MTRTNIRSIRITAILLAAAGSLQAQTDSATVVSGAEYRAGRFHRWLLGNNYRDLWTAPLRVEVLDLEHELGGLRPVERTGQVQTPGLRFQARDSSEYNFRSVDKELTPALPPYAQETLVDFIRQDATSAQMPIAAPIVARLLDAVGAMHPGPRLVVLPDDERLGEYREEFGGRFGMLEAHPNEIREGVGGFAGSVEVKDTEDMLDDVEENPRNRIDDRAFLTARLIDVLVGDWDRHPGQWRWARYDRQGVRWWVPVAEDRDYAFASFGGAIMGLARKAVGGNRLVVFSDRYPPLSAMTANSLPLNRRVLAELPWPVWDSIAAHVQARLTDAVLADAVAQVPVEVREETERALLGHLRARRDGMRDMARRFYDFMAAYVEVESTDADEVATIVRRPDGEVEVGITTASGIEVYRRRFHPDETEEVRIDLHGGDDRATVQGEGGPITVRIQGGGGDDRLEAQGAGPTFLYDSRGNNELIPARGGRADRRSFDAPVRDSASVIPDLYRDWGSVTTIGPWADWRSNVGPVVGGRARWTRYAFRTVPHASVHEVRALVAPLYLRGALEYRGDLRRENSDRWLELRADATTLHALRFNGFGNDTEQTGSEGKVWMRELLLTSLWHVPLSPIVEVAPGIAAGYSDPRPDAGSPLAVLQPPGYDGVGRIQAFTTLLVDSRDDVWYPTRGMTVEGAAVAVPPIWDLDDAYGRVNLTAAGYVGLPVLERSVLALRAGGVQIFGDFPFQASAFLGGSESIRGYQGKRFAGDAMLFGNAEVRVPVTRVELLVRWDLGVSVLADAGRVFMDGESPGGWHGAAGGSVWLTTPILALSLTYARGEENRFYVDIGLPLSPAQGTAFLR